MLVQKHVGEDSVCQGGFDSKAKRTGEILNINEETAGVPALI